MAQRAQDEASEPADSLSADMISGLRLEVRPIESREATRIVVANHYLHRRPPISFAFGLYKHGLIVGVVTFGVPASRHLQMGACPSDPGKVIELNRLWVDDSLPTNTESWFVSRAMRELPPRIVVSYADPVWGHYGYIYRALNFHYAGWTDMERKTPRYDYIATDPRKHTRESSRSGVAYKRRRVAKVKYWTTTGTRSDRRRLRKLCGWRELDWKSLPPPIPEVAAEALAWPPTSSRSGRFATCAHGGILEGWCSHDV